MSSEFETDGLSGSNEALAAYLGRYEYTVVFERADGRLREEPDRPTIEGTSGHRSTHLFAEKRRSRGPRAHAKLPASFRKGAGSVVACGRPWATRSRVTPLPGGSQAATRGVRSSGPNASSRFVERGGNVTGWEGRLAKGLSPEPPGSSGPRSEATSFVSGSPGMQGRRSRSRAVSIAEV